jgi:hypothetical protein
VHRQVQEIFDSDWSRSVSETSAKVKKVFEKEAMSGKELL